ncbi:unnamed protein product [Mytilus edulis]|uniref:Uncharacterized protein n=1 Tax=Mytilus edulis TaxID=6550 RepID=A0A8S3TPW0_MYTED|nr:unnamed protein product [Mytilus edulis]
MEEESNERHRIFKCLVYTGSDVLRDTVKRKMLINTSFEQYLNQNKHKFYHQFEKSRYKPCCSGNPHNCVVNGKMDRIMFFKMYNIKAELDTQDCLIDLKTYRYKKSIEREIKTLKNYDHDLKLESKIMHESIDNMAKEETDGLKYAIKHGNESTKTDINKVQDLIENREKESRTMQCKKRIKAHVQREGMKTRLQSKRNRNSLDKRLSENREKESRTMQCKKRIKAHVQREGMKTRLQSKRNRNSLDKRLSAFQRTKERERTCRKSNKRKMIKMSEKAQEELIQHSKRLKTGKNKT